MYIQVKHKCRHEGTGKFLFAGLPGKSKRKKPEKKKEENECSYSI